MRFPALLAPVTLVVLLTAGCTGRGLDCPDEYGPQFEEQYKRIVDDVEEQGGVVPADADRDCVADVVEQAVGTDANDAASYPTVEQLSSIGPDGNVTPPPPPPPTYAWSEETFDGDFQSIPGSASGATGAVFFYEVPDGAVQVYFNVTVQGTTPDEFMVWFRDPENLEQGGSPTAEATTTNGEASVLVAEPAGGDWRASLFSETLPNAGTYTLRVNAQVLVGTLPVPTGEDG